MTYRSKILIVPTTGLGLHGISIHLLNYLSQIDRTNKDFYIVVTIDYDKNIIEKLKELGVKIYFLPDRKKNLLSYAKKLRELVIKEEINIIHIHGNSETMVFELISIFGLKIDKKIVHTHAIQSKYGKITKLLRLLFLAFDKINVAVTEQSGKNLYGDNQFSVISNLINLQDHYFKKKCRDSIREKYNLNEKYVLGYIARFDENKNHKFIIGLAKQLDDHYAFILVGNGTLLSGVKQDIKELGLKNRFIFLEPTIETSCLYSAFDLFLFPSKSESYGLVALEAQLNGLNVIYSDTIPQDTSLFEENKFLKSDLEFAHEWINQIYLFKSNLCFEDRELKSILARGIAAENEKTFDKVKKMEDLYEV